MYYKTKKPREPGEKGKPQAEIQKEVFEALCSVCCTENEIADRLGICRNTLKSWVNEIYGDTYLNVYNRFSSEAKVSLRRKQIESALDGNTAMMIWLGKQLLEQADKIEKNQKISISGNISSLSDEEINRRIKELDE